jgi:hypothetical protein
MLIGQGVKLIERAHHGLVTSWEDPWCRGLQRNMRQTLRDYGYKLTKVPLLYDNESAICMVDNPVEHIRTKHIAIRYHFLRDHQQRGISRLLMLAPKNN